MARLLLVHWRPAEAAAGVRMLRAAGHSVRIFDRKGGAGLGELRRRPPEALLIDLSRLPSHGREVAEWFRATRATRTLPLVFLGGTEEKVERARRQFPGAEFADWRRVRGAVRPPLRRPRRDPPPPRPRDGGMPGYSGTRLPRKIGLRPGEPAILIDAPAGIEEKLAPLPAGTTLRRGARGRAPVVLLFVRNRAALERRFAAAERATAPGGRLWLVWPKKAGALAADLSQPAVRAFGLERAWVDYKVCAVDVDWSGLAFARRPRRS
ncbi:MAG: hypothetical protein D6702_09330 [Planctomycetota bacterium]|nr:MAG: hypothetical protein D6702_09330 [Planctomycetota bacterium]